MGLTTKTYINELNMKQILDEQSSCYAKRIGTIYGDFKVIDIWYDWDNRKQMWKLECTKCGKIKITYNGKDYTKGKNKGNCECGKTQSLKKSPKIKKDNLVSSFSTHKLESKYKSANWIGQRFGHLVITKYVNAGRVECVCDCGNKVVTHGSNLEKSRQLTCGRNCEHHMDKVKTHGLSKDRLFRIWKGMKRRCYDLKDQHYYLYGGRGIDICEEWRDDVFAFREWALSNGYSDNLTIDRIDSDKGYSPDNCRWATVEEQNNHLQPRWTFKPKQKYVKKKVVTWEINGVKKSINEWCEEYGLSRSVVTYRVNVKGMSPYEALTIPLAPQGRGRKSL